MPQQGMQPHQKKLVSVTYLTSKQSGMTDTVNQFTQDMRRFVYESYATFQRIPKDIDYHISSEAERITLQLASVRFRTHLQRLTADLNSNKQRNPTIDPLISSANVICFEDCETIYSIEKSWHLCEIFGINESDMISIELIKWLKGICYDSEEIRLEHILNADEPETIETISPVCLGYWDAAYANAMQGEISTVVQLLRVHSEISQIYGIDHGILTSSAATEAQCDAFFDLLESHPYALLVSSFVCVDQMRDSSSAAVLSLEFSSWHKRAQKLRMTGSDLFVSIPELDTILRILLGESSTLEQCSGLSVGREWAWGRLAIALLLYVHPPPLTRPDLCRILEDCIWKQSALYDGTEIEIGYMHTLKEVMSGNLAPTLRSLYQLGTTRLNRKCGEYCDLSLIPLLCAAHLSLLLAGSMDREDLFIPMPDSVNEVSFFEEIFLESVQRLHSAQFPYDMIINYLALCPMRGREFARVLLPLMATYSDRSTFTVAAALRDVGGCFVEADALLRTRGMWWLTRTPPPPLYLANTPGVTNEQLLRSSTLAKAAVFFLAAGDLSRVGALLKGSLARCMWAVVSCTPFKGLSFCPGNDSLWANDLNSAYLSSGGIRTSEDSSLELNASLNEAKELQDALSEAALCGVTDLHRTALGIYTSAIESWIKPSQQRSIARQTIVLLSKLLLTEESRSPLVSIEHWLHILELIVWLSHYTAKYEDWSGALSKDCVYTLLTVFQEAKHSYGARKLQKVIQSGNFERSLQSLKQGLLGLLSCTILEDNSKSCNSVSTHGEVKRLNKYINGEMSRFKVQSNFVSPVMDVKNQMKQTEDAFELLTGSNLFAYMS